MSGWRKRQVLEMAREAGFDTDLPPFQDGTAIALKLAELVASAEREACWNIIFEYAGRDDITPEDESLLKHLADLIRTRGQA